MQNTKKQSYSIDHIKIARNRGSVDETVQESDLVRQLLFVFGNTTSTDIVDNGDGYQIRPTLLVADPVRKMVS